MICLFIYFTIKGFLGNYFTPAVKSNLAGEKSDAAYQKHYLKKNPKINFPETLCFFITKSSKNTHTEDLEADWGNQLTEYKHWFQSSTGGAGMI